MTFETVWAVYYSGTGTTRRVLQTMAAAVGEALGIPVRELDYTLPERREKRNTFCEKDLIFWGSPTYAGRQILPQRRILPAERHWRCGRLSALSR